MSTFESADANEIIKTSEATKVHNYRLIVVDDENEVRGRITEQISNKSGFTVVGSAGNGYDAIELIEKLSPHVVLTDIKMPYIDGIALATTIKQDYPTIRVAFLTGYDEFDYARQAIHLNVISYLTKPITQHELSQFLEELRTLLDKEHQEQYNQELLQERYQSTLPLLTENYLTSLLLSPEDSSTPIVTPRELGITLEGDFLLAEIRHITKKRSNFQGAENYTILGEEKKKLALQSLIARIIERYGLTFFSFQFGGGILLIMQKKSAEFLNTVDTALFEIAKTTEKFLSASVRIGVSAVHHNIADLPIAYKESTRSLHNTPFLGNSDIIYHNQLKESPSQSASISPQELQHIEHIAKMGTTQEITDAFSNLAEKLGSAANLSSLAYQNILIHLGHMVTSVTESLEVEPTYQEPILTQIQRIQGIQEALHWAMEQILTIREENLQRTISRGDKLFDQALSKMHLQYTNPKLSMLDICEELAISQSYLSLLFKQHKTTFVKTLTKIRIEKSKELLARTTLRVIEIAGQCGYSDVYYFSHSFKKYQGVSPKGYREEVTSV